MNPMALLLQHGPEALKMIGGLLGNGVTSGSGALPQQSKFQLGIEESMGRPNPNTKGFDLGGHGGPAYNNQGGGFGLGLKSGALPVGGTGEITVTADAPQNQSTGIDPDAGPGRTGKGGVAGMPPWMDKLMGGLQVGEALRPEQVRPPSLPGGGRFDHENSVLKFLQMMGRR